MVRMAGGSWQMALEEKAEVQRSHRLDGQWVNVQQLIWVEVEVGIWRCWLLSGTAR